MERAVISCAEASEGLMAVELREIFPGLPIKWIGAGIALAEHGRDFNSFAEEVRRQSPLFLRHIAPIQREVPLRADKSDIDTLANAAEQLARHMNAALTFAVQSRIMAEGPQPFRKYDVNSALSSLLERLTGARMDTRAPEQVVSILCTSSVGYLGVSRTELNRSPWPGGERRFKREEAQVSRSEFKLIEAMEVFGLRFPTGGVALDIGAAPGGWTRILRQHGLRVVAVDPGEMDERFRRDRSVTVVRKRIQDYLPCSQAFDVIVNDLRMDARESVGIMLSVSEWLQPNGPGVMTLKLPETGVKSADLLRLVRECLARLSDKYSIIGARQLFHNRSEVTVALRQKEEV